MLGRLVIGFNMSQEKTPELDQHRGLVVPFHMVPLSSKPDAISLDEFMGPLLDNGLPYSDIGLTQFNMLQAVLLFSWNDDFDPISVHISGWPHCEY